MPITNPDFFLKGHAPPQKKFLNNSGIKYTSLFKFIYCLDEIIITLSVYNAQIYSVENI